MSSRPCAKRRRLIVNAAFAAAVLLAAGLAWWALRRSSGPAQSQLFHGSIPFQWLFAGAGSAPAFQNGRHPVQYRA